MFGILNLAMRLFRPVFVCFNEDDGAGGGGGGGDDDGRVDDDVNEDDGAQDNNDDAGDAQNDIDNDVIGTPTPVAKKPAAAAAPEDLEIPEALRQRYGGATRLSELHRNWETQTNNQRAAYERQMQLVASAIKLMKQGASADDAAAAAIAGAGGQPGARQQQQRPAAAATAANDYYGFASAAEYQAALKADPQGTQWKVLAHQMRNRPEMREALRAMAEEIYGPQFQQLQESEQQRQAREQAEAQQRFEGHMYTLSEKLIKSRPDFAPGGQYHDAWAKWWNDNWQEQCYLAQRNPKYDPYEAGARWVLGEIAPAQVAAAQKRQKQIGQQAATARPGSAAPVVQKRATNLRESIAQAAAQARASGQDLTDEDVKAAELAFSKFGL